MTNPGAGQRRPSDELDEMLAHLTAGRQAIEAGAVRLSQYVIGLETAYAAERATNRHLSYEVERLARENARLRGEGDPEATEPMPKIRDRAARRGLRRRSAPPGIPPRHSRRNPPNQPEARLS